MSQNDKDETVSDSLALDDFKTWSSVALKIFLSLRNRSVNGSVDVSAARYVPFLNYVEGRFYLKEYYCSTCTCLRVCQVCGV